MPNTVVFQFGCSFSAGVNWAHEHKLISADRWGVVAVLVQEPPLTKCTPWPFHTQHFVNTWKFTSVFIAKGAGPITMFTTLPLAAFMNYGAPYKIQSVWRQVVALNGGGAHCFGKGTHLYFGRARKMEFSAYFADVVKFCFSLSHWRCPGRPCWKKHAAAPSGCETEPTRLLPLSGSTCCLRCRRLFDFQKVNPPLPSPSIPSPFVQSG